jgi:hypothetical protein
MLEGHTEIHTCEFHPALLNFYSENATWCKKLNNFSDTGLAVECIDLSLAPGSECYL